MRRYQAVCRHCGLISPWQGNREICRDGMLLHLKEEHGPAPGQAADGDYELIEQRQCDYCLEAYLDHCTKCDRDFRRFHQGDIDGLCGGCI
ncbi:MAG: hypothetical protein HY790_09340 [Deltaproteobacteria bacterium]|nr:hypothetical protein [Deltaproteobacteria bacterium]MBI4796019.1 hypothetical protein [Deltaproteobacteria bacterium]